MNQEAKRFLHIGCGGAQKNATTRWFAQDEWKEVRFDADVNAAPDIIGSLAEMGAVADGAFEGIFTSHSVEQLYPHEVPGALRNLHRVLSETGHLVMTCADLQAVCAHVAEDRLVEPLYTAAAGPVAALDILYGFRPALAAGAKHMAHHCGFTLRVLLQELQAAGFQSLWGARNAQSLTLVVIAAKAAISKEEMQALAGKHFGAPSPQ